MTPTALRALRQSLGLTQGQAARLVGVDSRSWRKWENNERHAPESATRLLRLMAELPGVRAWLEACEGSLDDAPA